MRMHQAQISSIHAFLNFLLNGSCHVLFVIHCRHMAYHGSQIDGTLLYLHVNTEGFVEDSRHIGIDLGKENTFFFW